MPALLRAWERHVTVPAPKANEGNMQSTISSKAYLSCKIFQINLQHYNAAIALICYRINSCKAIMHLIQIPWVVGREIRGLNFQHAELLCGVESDRALLLNGDFKRPSSYLGLRSAWFISLTMN